MLVWSLLALVPLFTVLRDAAEGAEFRIQPAVTLREWYDDNVFLTPNDKKYDYITEFIPGFNIVHRTSFWSTQLDFAYDYRDYLKRTQTKDYTYLANFLNHTMLVDNQLFLDVKDQYQRVSNTVIRNYAQESLFVNQTDQNIFTANPYLVEGLGSSHKVTLGYRYVNTWYRDPLAIKTVDNIGYLETASSLSANMTFSTGVNYTRDWNRVSGYYKTDFYAGPRYTYAPNSFFFCWIGETWLQFQGYDHIKHFIWDLGLTHRYSTMTLAVETKTQTLPDPYNILTRDDLLEASLTKESTTRTSLRGAVGWHEYRNAATDHLESTTYVVSGTLKHALTQKLTFTGDISNESIHDYVASSNTYIYQVGLRLDRGLTANSNVALAYWYTYAYSPNVYNNNYISNRASVEFTQRF